MGAHSRWTVSFAVPFAFAFPFTFTFALLLRLRRAVASEMACASTIVAQGWRNGRNFFIFLLPVFVLLFILPVFVL